MLGILEEIVTAIANDPAAARAGKMCREDQGPVAIVVQEVLPRPSCEMRIDAKIRAPVRITELKWRMHQVGTEDRFCSFSPESHDELAGRVPMCRLDIDAFAKAMPVVDQVGLSTFDDRSDTVGNEVTCSTKAHDTCVGAPILPFPPRYEIARVGKRRHPFSALEPRVPSHVIDVQMRAHDNVDVSRVDAGGFEFLQPAPFSLVKKQPATPSR